MTSTGAPPVLEVIGGISLIMVSIAAFWGLVWLILTAIDHVAEVMSFVRSEYVHRCNLEGRLAIIDDRLSRLEQRCQPPTPTTEPTADTIT